MHHTNKAIDPKVSVVIPCYNSGQFLPDALSSIKEYPHADLYEVIIVNDGSDDQRTLALLQSLRDTEEYIIIDQPNKGPAAARNTGIKNARGKYILFLDSDNKIRPASFEKGITILDSRSEVGIVHGNAEFFGDTTETRFKGRAFELISIFENNYIDMCAMIRKQVWQDVGGLDENRILIGHEDWDFWIRIGNTPWQFYYLDEVVFDYRVRNNSLIKQVTEGEKLQNLLNYTYAKNINILIKKAVNMESNYCYDQNHPFRAFIKYMYYKYVKKRVK
jgi:glycosyltransferase involved in cell wall biosynthesis